MLRRALFAPSADVLTRIDLEVVRGGLSPGRLPDELMQRIRQFAVLIGAALAQLSRYLFRNVTNPTFREVKATKDGGYDWILSKEDFRRFGNCPVLC